MLRILIPITLCIILILGLLLPIVNSATLAIDASIAHSKIEKLGEATDVKWIYSEGEEERSNEELAEMLNKLPASIRKELEKNWYIIVSEKDPFGSNATNSTVIGAMHDRAKVIWLSPNFTERVLYHEIGHAIASKNSADYSDEFRELYNLYWEKDIVSEAEESDHDVSTPAELFAHLFSQHIMNQEDLKEKFEEGSKYMTEFIEEFNSSFIFSITSSYLRYYRNLFHDSGNSGFSLSRKTEASLIDNKVKNNPKIDLTSRTPCVSYAGLSEKEKEVVKEILDVIENPNNYLIQEHNDSDVAILQYDSYLSMSSYAKIAACVDFNLLQEKSDVFDMNTSSSATTVYIYIEKANELKEKREEYRRECDRVIAELHEGSETEILLQVTKYIAEHCKSRTIKTTSGEDFWVNGRGDCVTYAMIFRQFCERLGIQCDIVYGTIYTNTNHTWNRVRLSDGTYRYYDLANYSIGAINMSQYDEVTTYVVNGYKTP